MNYKVLVFFALFAFGKAEEGCREARAQECLDNLLNSVLSADTQDEMCRELREVTECLRSTSEDCLSEDEQKEVEEGIRELEQTLGDECPVEDYDNDEDEAENCLEENKDYIMQCMGQGTVQAMRLIEDHDQDVNFVKCSVYSLISDCVLEKTLEKCGPEVRNLLKQELDNPPREIKDACEASADRQLTNVVSLIKRRKK